MIIESTNAGKSCCGIPVRAAVQGVVAGILAVITTVVALLLVGGFAKLCDQPQFGWFHRFGFLFFVGGGLCVCTCLGFLLGRVSLAMPTRLWCWIAGCNLFVLAMPLVEVAFRAEKFLIVLFLSLFAMSFAMWMVWLPWWRPKWLKVVTDDR